MLWRVSEVDEDVINLSKERTEEETDKGVIYAMDETRDKNVGTF